MRDVPRIDKALWIWQAPAPGLEYRPRTILEVLLVSVTCITPYPHVVDECGTVGITAAVCIAPGAVRGEPPPQSRPLRDHKRVGCYHPVECRQTRVESLLPVGCVRLTRISITPVIRVPAGGLAALVAGIVARGVEGCKCHPN